ncbi:hypothetical protein BaRGS_00020458 [Batillaria attramentaria]|uniref:Uncharacterized protein n=1 Tax=Batillaria attramentaria TaxID=370345 RepID=A0ABD0KMF7_9CAEN
MKNGESLRGPLDPAKQGWKRCAEYNGIGEVGRGKDAATQQFYNGNHTIQYSGSHPTTLSQEPCSSHIPAGWKKLMFLCSYTARAKGRYTVSSGAPAPGIVYHRSQTIDGTLFTVHFF